MNGRFLRGFFLVLIGAACFSTKAIFIKFAYRHGISYLPLLTLRMLFAFPFFLGTLIWHSRHVPLSIGHARKDILMAMVLGLLGYYVSSLWDFMGLQYISVGLERLTLFLYPTVVLLISAYWFKTSIDMRDIRALALCYAGIVLVFTVEMQLSPAPKDTVIGMLYVGAAAITYAFYIVGNGIYVQKLGSIHFTALSMISATVSVGAHYFLTQPMSHLLGYDLATYGYALVLAIVCTVLPTFLVSEGIKQVGSERAGIIAMIGPVITMMLGALFLDEPLTGLQVLGTLLVIAGVLSVRHGPKTDKE